ncbi:MAG: KTSC domain-containing protein [Acidobacteria bacterium]|nr:KTSC domain-containing protein [Acidobacteriota bacterium]
MNRTPVQSTNVTSIGYDASTMTLEVEFTNGSVYQYFDVPEMEYHNLIGAESVGRYLNQNIKNSYRYVRT